MTNTVASGSTDGAGDVVINTDGSSPGGLGQNLGNQSAYNIAPSGRGVLPDGSVVYLISPTKFVVLGQQQNASVETYEH